MSESKLWERIRKLELQAQKFCLELAAVAEKLRTAEERQTGKSERIVGRRLEER